MVPESQTPVAVALDIGGTSLRAALIDQGGRVRAREGVPTPARDGAVGMVGAAASLMRGLIRAHPELRTVAMGVGAAGVVDRREGSIHFSTSTLPGWAGTRLQTALSEGMRSYVPAALPVHVLNDVDAHAIGECTRGAGAGAPSVLVVAVGTGIGAALWSAEGLWSGAHHAAGEIGHFPARGADGLECPCGALGHLEAIGSGAGIARAYVASGGPKATPTGLAVMHAAEGGDPHAARAVLASAQATGGVLAGLVTTLDPSRVVMSGSVSQSTRWYEAMVDGLRTELIPLLRGVDIRRGSLGDDAGLLGAAHHALTEAGWHAW